jgi:argininosuccinate lyase
MELKLTEIAGDVGKKIHTARSRNDQVATLLLMYVVDSGVNLEAALDSTVRVFCRRAKDWAELAMPLQTHQQFAAPGSVGFWALRYATAFDRVRRHLAYCLSQWRKFCPLGSGAVAGSSVPIDRRVQARELGFESPSPNALDSTSTRDQCVEFMAVAGQLGLHMQSLAADVIVFSQTPFGWTVYPAAFATGSSMMPNKSNPDAMELLRGGCCEVLAAHAHMMLLLKGLPSGYNRDLQCIKPVVHHAVANLKTLVDMAVAFVAELEFDPERLSASLGEGDIEAALRMEAQVLEGVPLREAHHAVAAESQRQRSSTGGPHSQDVTRYVTVGSAAPSETRRTADEILEGLDAESVP